MTSHASSPPSSSTAIGRLASATFLFLSLSYAALAADWPGWRGPNRDGHSLAPIPASLPENPTVTWKIPLGHGYASPVIASNTVIICDDSNNSETAHAIDAGSGRELWKTPYAPAWSDEFEPGPRCTPLIHGNQLFVQSAQGRLACLRLSDGQILWSVDFKDLGMVWSNERSSNVGAAVRRGHTGSPIVDGDRIFVQVGSLLGSSIVAFNRFSGQVIWKSLDDPTAYSSPVIGTLAGTRQFITATCVGLVGLDLSDGRLLWRVPFKTAANRNVLTPILLGDDVLFASHSTGFQSHRITRTNSTLQPVERWFNRQLRINLPTPVLSGSHLYGIGAAKDFVCIDASSGQVTWSEKGFGEVGHVISDGSRQLVLLESGELRLLAVNPGRYEELGRFQACGKTFSQPAWNGSLLLVRDPSSLTAWSIVRPGS
jgi:outer membrane protein assembly factor BamB